MNPMTWKEISAVFDLLLKKVRREWRCRIPAPDHALSPSGEQECDEWCRWIARNSIAPCRPPLALRPWILARIETAALEVRMIAQSDLGPDPGNEPHEWLDGLLIREWSRTYSHNWRERLQAQTGLDLRQDSAAPHG